MQPSWYGFWLFQFMPPHFSHWGILAALDLPYFVRYFKPYTFFMCLHIQYPKVGFLHGLIYCYLSETMASLEVIALWKCGWIVFWFLIHIQMFFFKKFRMFLLIHTCLCISVQKTIYKSWNLHRRNIWGI